MAESDGQGSLRERRFAANQTVFRRSNERLIQRLGSLVPGFDGVCLRMRRRLVHRSHLAARERVGHVRSNSAWFLIALDHEILACDSERILETHDPHNVIEKSGAAGATAKATDIRLNRVAP